MPLEINAKWYRPGLKPKSKAFIRRFNPRTPAKTYPHRGTKGDWWNPSPEFLICCIIFCLQWKAFHLLYKMRYILWVVGPDTCDVTKHSHHLGRHLEFYHELENRVKTQELAIFCAWHEKQLLNKYFATFFLSLSLTFSIERSWKKNRILTTCRSLSGSCHMLLMTSYIISIVTDHH